MGPIASNTGSSLASNEFLFVLSKYLPFQIEKFRGARQAGAAATTTAGSKDDDTDSGNEGRELQLPHHPSYSCYHPATSATTTRAIDFVCQ
jgi:hypothetical protein